MRRQLLGPRADLPLAGAAAAPRVDPGAAGGDPRSHPFARAQAVRSLGWCADPTGVEHLRRLTSEDPHPEVRRSAAKAAERIVGYWTFYGEWDAIARSAARAFAAAEALADLGLRTFAFEVTVRFGDAGGGEHPALDALSDALEADLPPSGFDEMERRYPYWFAEAQALEAAGEPAMTAEAAVEAASAAGARGFEGRRFLRKHARGPAERRRAPLR